MSISQPSRTVYAVSVPEATGLTAKFIYNFFSPDESVNASGGVPSVFLSRPADQVDANFIQYSVTRAPRLVQFKWNKPKVADVGNAVSDLSLRNNSFRTTGAQYGSLILDNLSKVITEDDFTAGNYAAVAFHDGEIDDRVHTVVSGTFASRSLLEATDDNTTPYKQAQSQKGGLPAYVKSHFVFKALTLGSKQGAGYSQPSPGASPGALSSAPAQPYVDDYFEAMKSVTTYSQVNVKFLHDLVNGAIQDPNSTNANDFVDMHSFSKQAKQATGQRQQLDVTENDFKTFVPFTKVKKLSDSPHAQKYNVEHVGYIIDKFEVGDDGTMTMGDPIIIDSPNVNSTADFQVKFNTTYCYTIRSVVWLTLPAIDDTTSDVVTMNLLVTSRPSNKVYVKTIDPVPPPFPGDPKFIWEYSTSRLLVTWEFPVTSQRDVKQFQVFRRAKVTECYELQKQYNFDDSVVPLPYNESPDPALVERLTSPCGFWYDDDFDWDVNNSRDSGLIYAIACIDAHGLTSPYSAQFKVWFDRFQNSIQTELISHAGAPKAYPNLYVDGDLFENTIRVQGPNTQRLRLYFTPEFYWYVDDHGRAVHTIETLQTGGSYRLQFINLDNLKASNVTVSIDDRTTQGPLQTAPPVTQLGRKRSPQSGA